MHQSKQLHNERLHLLGYHFMIQRISWQRICSPLSWTRKIDILYIFCIRNINCLPSNFIDNLGRRVFIDIEGNYFIHVFTDLWYKRNLIALNTGMSDVSMFFNEVFNIMYYFESDIVMRSQSYDHEVTVIGT